MSYLGLARRYRPQMFADVIGQEAIVQTFVNALSADRVAQAYLLTGPRGVGKTTLARVLSMALNCPEARKGEPCGRCGSCRQVAEGNDVDVLEVDGASHNGVEAVRQICANVLTLPTRGKYRIYIVDEVHMLSGPAFNALLKTLEEPPPHVKFIFATTHPHKVLPTVLSRCQRFDLRRIGPDVIGGRLAEVCRKEKIGADKEALHEIAARADGGMRDALTILDQAWAQAAPDRLTAERLRGILGLEEDARIDALLDAVLAGGARPLLARVEDLWLSGTDLESHARQLMERLRQRVADEPLGPVRARLLALGESLLDRWPQLGPGRVGRAAFEWALLSVMDEGAPEGASAPIITKPKTKPAAAPSPAPSLTAAPEPPAVTMEAVKVRWGEFLARVRAQSRSTGAFLETAEPGHVGPAYFEVVFKADNRFHKDAVEQAAHRGTIESCFKEVYGAALKLKTRALAHAEPAPMIKTDEAEVPADPLLKRAADIFQGRVVTHRKEARE